MGCELDLAWAAGFIDGEGYVHLQPVHKRRSDGYTNRKPRIEVAQVDPSALLKLKRILGGSIITMTPRNGRKQSFRWDLTGVRVVPALEALLPYLTVKRAQALLLLEYASLMRAKGESPHRGLNEFEMKARDTIQQRMLAERSRTFTLESAEAQMEI
jgi:hypothetical protein